MFEPFLGKIILRAVVWLPFQLFFTWLIFLSSASTAKALLFCLCIYAVSLPITGQQIYVFCILHSVSMKVFKKHYFLKLQC